MPGEQLPLTWRGTLGSGPTSSSSPCPLPAESALTGAGKDAAELASYAWHANRHTWASRLTMAGVDPRTIMALGGWSNLGMLACYSHLTPGHHQAAVETLVTHRANTGPARLATKARISAWIKPGSVSVNRAERPTVVTAPRKVRLKCACVQAFDRQILLARPLNLTPWSDS